MLYLKVPTESMVEQKTMKMNVKNYKKYMSSISTNVKTL